MERIKKKEEIIIRRNNQKGFYNQFNLREGEINKSRNGIAFNIDNDREKE